MPKAETKIAALEDPELLRAVLAREQDRSNGPRSGIDHPGGRGADRGVGERRSLDGRWTGRMFASLRRAFWGVRDRSDVLAARERPRGRAVSAGLVCVAPPARRRAASPVPTCGVWSNGTCGVWSCKTPQTHRFLWKSHTRSAERPQGRNLGGGWPLERVPGRCGLLGHPRALRQHLDQLFLCDWRRWKQCHEFLIGGHLSPSRDAIQNLAGRSTRTCSNPPRNLHI